MWQIFVEEKAGVTIKENPLLTNSVAQNIQNLAQEGYIHTTPCFWKSSHVRFI
jgi:hypothetical protein